MFRSTIFLALAAVLLAACGDATDEQTPPAAAAPEVTAMKLAAEPEGVRDVAEVKEAAKVGDEVVVFGRVRKFSEGYASFVLTGPEMRHCAEREADTCPTPWDYCCEDSEDVAAHSLNVEFREGDRPFKEKLEGRHGLKLLADVVVKGKIAEIRGDNVTIAAEGFFVRP